MVVVHDDIEHLQVMVCLEDSVRKAVWRRKKNPSKRGVVEKLHRIEL